MNPSFVFRIGERDYHVRRTDDRHGRGFCIVCNGDMVEYVSSAHWGDVGAFRLIARRLEDTELAWSKAQR